MLALALLSILFALPALGALFSNPSDLPAGVQYDYIIVGGKETTTSSGQPSDYMI
jgi:hypothetical protein